MRTFLALTLFALACTAAKPAEPDFSAFDKRLAALESRVTALEKLADHALETGALAAPKRTYEQAHAESLASGRPLVVWQGSAVCPACVQNTADEFVHCVTSNLEGTNPNSVTIYVPENGTLQTAGEVTWWVTSDKTYGHIPSVRRILANWRANRTMHRQMMPAAYGGGMGVGYRAMAVVTAPVRMMARARGGCASCGR